MAVPATVVAYVLMITAWVIARLYVPTEGCSTTLDDGLNDAAVHMGQAVPVRGKVGVTVLAEYIRHLDLGSVHGRWHQ
jgi:hypothetical protein